MPLMADIISCSTSFWGSEEVIVCQWVCGISFAKQKKNFTLNERPQNAYILRELYYNGFSLISYEPLLCKLLCKHQQSSKFRLFWLAIMPFSSLVKVFSNHVHFTASHVLLIHRQCCVFNSDPLILSHPKTNMALYWLMLSLIFIRQLRHLIEQWGSPCFLLWSPGGEAATRPSRRTQALLCCLIVIKDFFQPQPEYSWDWPWSLYIT